MSTHAPPTGYGLAKIHCQRTASAATSAPAKFLFCRQAPSVWALLDYRRKMSLTCTAVQSPPRAVRTPRAVRALATPRRPLTPLAWISLMMGRTLAANASAASLRALLDALRAAARRGPPSLTPRRLAAASAALVRSLMAVRSCSATAARMWTVSLLACGFMAALHRALTQAREEAAALREWQARARRERADLWRDRMLANAMLAQRNPAAPLQ